MTWRYMTRRRVLVCVEFRNLTFDISNTTLYKHCGFKVSSSRLETQEIQIPSEIIIVCNVHVICSNMQWYHVNKFACFPP